MESGNKLDPSWLAEEFGAQVLQDTGIDSETDAGMKPKRLQRKVAPLAICAAAGLLLLASGLDCRRDVGNSKKEDFSMDRDEKAIFLSKTVFVQIGEREYRVDAKGDSLSHAEIQSVMVDIADWFDRLNWPENRPVLLNEDRDSITVTCPVPDEMEDIPYRSDYTLQIILDRRTKAVLRVAGGG